jgi:uncharacterized phage protein (TIGR02218 family)
MPRIVTPAFESHLQQETTTIAILWKITRADGVILTFTDASSDIVFEGRTYQARTGYTASAIASRSDFSVDNLDVAGLLDSAAITEADILAGAYDDAEVEISRVNYADLTQGRDILRVGNIGQITSDGSIFNAEIRGIAQKLQNSFTRIVTNACNATFGDARCTLDLSSLTFSVSVTSVTESNRIFTSSSLLQAEHFFRSGIANFTSGANAGFKREVSAFKLGQITVAEPFPHAILTGDNFTVVAGCNKKKETCKSFNNIKNFRGFPDVPGVDRLSQNFLNNDA